ncbi:hypothetical protein J4450_03745 [Candidatus Micrarchaeota archaeon]|nr:hypothetical protein [Candidatus Micrarchaeota archaeon]
MKRTRGLMLATALAIGGGAGCNQEKINKEVTKLKACPDRYRTSCLSPDQIAKKEQEATQLEKQRKYADAAKIYVELGQFNDAKRMIGECILKGYRCEGEISGMIQFRQAVFGQLETEK